MKRNPSSVRVGALTTLAIGLLLVPAPLVPAGPGNGPPCADFQDRHGIGDSCRRADGLYEIFSRDGRTSLGFTHGLDPVPAEGDGDASAASGPLPVMCVDGAAGTYYNQVIYARAADDADGYGASVAGIRTLTENANGLVNDAAVATGGTASLKVKCVGGVIEVKNEVLPTAMASASFSTIVADLTAKGYTNGKVHHWVYYDDPGACGCGGTGHIYGDDSPSETNLNNGNGGALFAVSFGYLTSTRIWLHELGHNMGAVQNSAPRSTGGYHCIDGLDTMCYNDGGPNGGSYSSTVCAGEVFDCGKNDYFHRHPAGGSYLATHWNVGDAKNRFIVFDLTDSTPPSLTVTDPTAGFAYVGCVGAPTPTFGAMFILQGCARGTASDSTTGLAHVKVYYNGVLKGTSATSPFAIQWTVTGPATGQTVLVVATDNAGNTASVTRTVDVLK